MSHRNHTRPATLAVLLAPIARAMRTAAQAVDTARTTCQWCHGAGIVQSQGALHACVCAGARELRALEHRAAQARAVDPRGQRDHAPGRSVTADTAARRAITLASARETEQRAQRADRAHSDRVRHDRHVRHAHGLPDGAADPRWRAWARGKGAILLATGNASLCAGLDRCATCLTRADRQRAVRGAMAARAAGYRADLAARGVAGPCRGPCAHVACGLAPRGARAGESPRDYVGLAAGVTGVAAPCVLPTPDTGPRGIAPDGSGHACDLSCAPAHGAVSCACGLCRGLSQCFRALARFAACGGRT